MRRSVLSLALLALAGCASGPSVASASGPAGPDALDCALAEATALGYAVAEAEAGVFFRARQPKRFRRSRGTNDFDVVTATAARGRLTVLAAGEQSTEDGVAAVDPSDDAEAEAAAIVAACAG